MDEYTADAFANRDEPIPLLTVTASDVEGSSSEVEKEGRRQALRRSLSASRMKEKIIEKNASRVEKIDSSPGSASIQDRLFAKLLQQVIPADDNDDEGGASIDRRSSKYIARPAFSLPLMTNNFRRFNARIGIVFVFQNRLIRLFTWKTTTHTLSFLAVYNFVCLDPSLLLVLPLATILLFIMVPAFITRHPPPPPPTSTSLTTPYSTYTYSGPALAPARTIRPASETSKDFFRNMRDLQNSMADFSNIHDTLIAVITPRTNFSNEIRSSTLFLTLTILTTLAFISAQLLPWRLILLLTGNTIIISGHPNAQIYLAKLQKHAEQKAQDVLTPPENQVTMSTLTTHKSFQYLSKILQSASAITLDSSPETREVEIFELQHRPLTPSVPLSTPSPEWTHHLFTPSPFDPLSPARIAGERCKGTRFFEDVQPPRGWAWDSKKWILDLEAGEWVGERLVVGVEYNDVHQIKDEEAEWSGTSDFGGWVWDLPPVYGGTRDEEVWLAYGDYDLPASKDEGRRKEKERGYKKAQSRDWEEETRWEGKGRTGEWRRRRWVRVVKRVGVGGSGTVDGVT